MSQGGYVKKHIVRELTQPQGKLLTSKNGLKTQDTNQHLYKIRLIYNWYTPPSPLSTLFRRKRRKRRKVRKR
jgi:hypothetical protein